MADWIATYRFQLHAGFPLDRARETLPYLASLGVSHVYLSPCLQAAPGSTHGYDVVDPTHINAEIGGEEAWQKFDAEARRLGLGVLLDIAPNHMATSAANPWWDDVLAHGPYSRFGGYYDLAPHVTPDGWRLRLPVLGKPYGDALREGELKLAWRNGAPRIEYFSNSWPAGPASWHLLLDQHEDLHALAALSSKTAPSAGERARYSELVGRAQRVLEDKTRQQDLARRVDAINADPPRLHAVLAAQFYTLHVWKRAAEVNSYRRFFDIDSLIGLRVESEEVFQAAHARVARLLEAGSLDGLRIDHPDGLRDPAGYFQRLRRLAPRVRVYIEKILDNDEHLRDGWPVDGTVGYEFLAKVNRLWMQDERSDALTAIYADFTGHPVNLPAVIREKKLAIIESSFASELDRLAALAQGLARRSWETLDLSQRQLREALKNLTVALPVYRTYRNGTQADDEDRRLISESLAAARMNSRGVEPEVFAFLERVMLQDNSPGALDFVLRWQQLTPAVTAKGVEDTSFYCYDRLVSCNEVGAQASLLGISGEKFHEFCHHLWTHWPRNLLATSTHDNKRSEDVRTRISVLSEIPDRFREALHQWSQLNKPSWKGRTPDRHAEYLLYQTLIGAWPIDEERCWNYMLKACREAKINTSWRQPSARYEEALREFIAGIYASEEFMPSLRDFVQPLLLPARINSLAQTLIKLTAPGVPDFYQGTELWDLSLVDPDNRRPVDYERRRSLLGSVEHVGRAPADLDWDSGLPKLWLIARTLAVRRRLPESFGPDGAYHPLLARGSRLGHILAYTRGENVITVVPRFTLTLDGRWSDTTIPLPPGEWRNEFTGATHSGEITPQECFGNFPVALLVK
jgi:(1->4)-alpha-D-glucan 1-alpha-D-glucosylmutase